MVLHSVSHIPSLRYLDPDTLPLPLSRRLVVPEARFLAQVILASDQLTFPLAWVQSRVVGPSAFEAKANRLVERSNLAAYSCAVAIPRQIDSNVKITGLLIDTGRGWI